MVTGGKDGQPIIHDFTKCPVCAGTHTLANDILQKEIEKGRMPKSSKAFLYQHQSIMAKPTGWLSAPIIITFYDACSDCGTTYCVHAEERVVIAGGKMLPASGGQFSSS